jgi:aldehyde:ferredoxin oxidoreductase
MNNSLLKIDLSKEEINIEELSDDLLENYLGGRGLGVKLLCDNLEKGVDPLSPANILIFSIGPLTGTIAPTSGRSALVTKSPLTNTILHSNSGGFWGVGLKRCGFDALYITGRLNQRGYIVIDGSSAEIKEAEELWGLSTEETLEKVRNIEGNCQILSIGPAGENLVRIAAIMNQAQRAFGRGGVGAVMGSKGLKAIVVKNGNKKFQQNLEQMKMLNQVASDKIKVFPVTSQGLPLFGTAVLIKVINAFGMLPVNNNQMAYIADTRVDEISGESLRERFLEKVEGCYGCPIRCGRLTNTGEMRGKGPEFESLWALGPQCGIFDLKTITHANYFCNRYGLDTISVGGTIACAMELQQRGLLEDSTIRFGNSDILCDIIRKIAYKEGIGEYLAEGALRFAERYQGIEYAMQVKGLELPAYDPRGAMGQALNFATSNRGACHLTGYLVGMELLGVPKLIDRFSLAKSDLLVLKQNQSAVEDSLVVCKFVGFALGLDYQVRFLKSITGQDYTIDKLVEIGERIYTLERLFNIREGFSRKDDTLPERFLKESLEEGPSKGYVVPLEKLLEDYYRIRRWDENGVPTDEVLQKLNLERLN